MLPARGARAALFAAAIAIALPASDSARGSSAVPDDLPLIPWPKHVEAGEGVLDLGRRLDVILPADLVPSAGSELAAELRRRGFPAPRLRASEEPTLRVDAVHDGSPVNPHAEPWRRTTSPEEYRLTIGPTGARIDGSDPVALHHGVRTLRQLIRGSPRGSLLPALEIHDWPSIRWRAMQDDITRGPSSHPEELRRELLLAAYLKHNVFTYYMQTQYAYSRHPKIGPPDGSLRPGELSELVALAKAHGVEVLGNQQSFAHLQDILRLPEYRDLGEDQRTLSPAREGSYRLLDDLYSDVIPRLPFEFFNVCCDETSGLGRGPSRDLAKEVGVGGVYLRHVLRVRELVRGKYGKRMMMWGDIVLQRPEILDRIPRDIVMLTWGYDRRESFEDQIVPFTREGFEFFVCPGVKCWGEVLPNYETAAINIRNFTRDGARHGALGFLNTSWDDDGENLNAPSWPGFAWGAECAWNASSTTWEEFLGRLDGALLGLRGHRFARAIELLSSRQAKGYGGLTNREFWTEEPTVLRLDDPESAVAEHERWLAPVREAIELLEACAEEATAGREIIDATLFGARRFELLGQRKIDRVRAALAIREAAGEEAPAAARRLARAESLLRKTRDAYARLRARWIELWRRENRPYSLDRVLARYDRRIGNLDALVERVAAAREAAEEGKTPTSPREVGLEIREVDRGLEPDARRSDRPLRAEARWLDPEATHRVGLRVAAEPDDRRDLPLVLPLDLPVSLSRRHARAWRQRGDAEPEEVPAQVMPPEGERTSDRAAVSLPGPLPAGEETTVWLYLGREDAPPPIPSAASIRTLRGGDQWIENDRVGLRLGSPGAHIWRWEVKALGGLDLTPDGASGWAGFSDLGGARRGIATELTPRTTGPALVTCDAVDAAGHRVTFRLWGGMGWVEARLDAPVGYYWNFTPPALFAGTGAAAGSYHFSTGDTGPVPPLANGARSQAEAHDATWVLETRGDGLTVGLITPGLPCRMRAGPGGSWGGVGIERSAGATRFISVGDRIDGDSTRRARELERTLDPSRPPRVTIHAWESRT